MKQLLLLNIFFFCVCPCIYSQLQEGIYRDCKGNFLKLSKGRMEFLLSGLMGEGFVKIKDKKLIFENDNSYIGGTRSTYKYISPNDTSNGDKLFFEYMNQYGDTLNPIPPRVYNIFVYNEDNRSVHYVNTPIYRDEIFINKKDSLLLVSVTNCDDLKVEVLGVRGIYRIMLFDNVDDYNSIRRYIWNWGKELRFNYRILKERDGMCTEGNKIYLTMKIKSESKGNLKLVFLLEKEENIVPIN